jgi:hypothetical protein
MQKLSAYKKVEMTKHCLDDEFIYPSNPWIPSEHLGPGITEVFDEAENTNNGSHTIEADN